MVRQSCLLERGKETQRCSRGVALCAHQPWGSGGIAEPYLRLLTCGGGENMRLLCRGGAYNTDLRCTMLGEGCYSLRRDLRARPCPGFMVQ